MDQLNNLNNTPDTTAEFDPSDIQNNKVMAILSYFGFLVLVPIFAAKDSKFARFHANQGLPLFIVEVLISFVTMVLGWIPLIGILVSLVMGLLGICVLVLAILGIINAANGRAKKLPITGGITFIK